MASEGAGRASHLGSHPEPTLAAERFFARLRQQLRSLPPDRRTPHPGRRSPDSTSSSWTARERVARFAEAWQAVGGECHFVRDRASLGQAIADMVTGWGAQTVLRTADGRWVDIGLDEALRQRGITVYPWGSEQGTGRHEAASAEVGLTWVDAAAARTGTLVELASEVNGRIASLLPPVHVAVVDAHRVFADRTAVFRWIREQGIVFSGMSLITGPSRTGDIQNDLTVGVHGPKRVVALMVGVDHPGEPVALNEPQD